MFKYNHHESLYIKERQAKLRAKIQCLLAVIGSLLILTASIKANHPQASVAKVEFEKAEFVG